MNNKYITLKKIWGFPVALTALSAVLCSSIALSQERAEEDPEMLAMLGTAADPREGSPYLSAPEGLDRIEGQWVSIVNEDWLWRMRVPTKGDFTSIPYNDHAREVGGAWDESMTGSCLAYGAAGLMRNPQRIRIEWESDASIKLQTDFGEQTRHFYFNRPAPENTPHTLQGYSEANWDFDEKPPTGFAGFSRNQPDGDHGALRVRTTHLSAAWLRANGAPVSENATVTEYIDVFTDPVGNDWLVDTVVVHDPEYLLVDYITSSHYRRDTDMSAWDPRPCGI